MRFIALVLSLLFAIPGLSYLGITSGRFLPGQATPQEATTYAGELVTGGLLLLGAAVLFASAVVSFERRAAAKMAEQKLAVLRAKQAGDRATESHLESLTPRGEND